MKIGIVGGGFVGSATALLECKDISIIIYDIDPTKCYPRGTSIKDLIGLDFIFVCVPTPSYSTGECNTTIVENCIATLKENGVTNIVLRSTVPPGTSDRLGVGFMPEFLTEANWANDFYLTSAWVFAGTSAQNVQFQQLLSLAKENKRIHNDKLISVTSTEAEMIKYVRNSYLATKVSFFNEMSNICERLHINYENVRSAVCEDSRIGQSHSRVPGPDGHRGFGGTCLPKDTNALLHFMIKNEVKSYILASAIERNYKKDRPEHDWEKDPRAFTSKK